jgi:hypothetical protein
VRDYGRVFCAIWGSRDFRALSEDGRALALYLLTCPHATMIGAFFLPEWYVLADLQWKSERSAEGFAELFRKGFATLCPRTQWVWIHKYLHWNEPENPNQWKGARRLAAKIPECTWLTDFQEFFDQIEAEAEAENKKRLPKGSQRVSKPGTGTGTGTGTGKGSGEGTGTVSQEGSGTDPVDNGDNSEGHEPKPEDVSGQSSPPQEPSPRRRNGSRPRHIGDFEAINDTVEKLVTGFQIPVADTKRLAQMAHVSELQVRTALRQLPDFRGLARQERELLARLDRRDELVPWSTWSAVASDLRDPAQARGSVGIQHAPRGAPESR